jgi:hypothetical protein
MVAAVCVGEETVKSRMSLGQLLGGEVKVPHDQELFLPSVQPAADVGNSVRTVA